MYDVVIRFDRVGNSFTAEYFENDKVVTYRFNFHDQDNFGGMTMSRFIRQGGYHPTMYITHNADGGSYFRFHLS